MTSTCPLCSQNTSGTVFMGKARIYKHKQVNGSLHERGRVQITASMVPLFIKKFDNLDIAMYITIEPEKINGICPLCNGSGSASSRIFLGSGKSYLYKKYWMARIYVKEKTMDDFRQYDGKKVLIVVMREKEVKEEMTPEQLEALLFN
jgi:hypothetical protein